MSPANTSSFMVSSQRDLCQISRDRCGFDHSPGMSSSSVMRCPKAAHPERTRAGAANQLPADRAPIRYEMMAPMHETRKIPRTEIVSLLTCLTIRTRALVQTIPLPQGRVIVSSRPSNARSSNNRHTTTLQLDCRGPKDRVRMKSEVGVLLARNA